MEMPTLTLWQNERSVHIPFEPGTPLREILVRCGYGIEHPCGGRGSCGKCAVEAVGGLSEPTPAEERAGCRLSCQIVLTGDAEVWLKDDAATAVELSGSAPALGTALGHRFGAAVDLGTTTIALKLYDLRTGRLLAEAGLPNPQRRIAADVMGRIGAAMDGRLDGLQEMALSAIQTLLERTCAMAGIGMDQVDAMVVAGNTTMLYLLTGRDPASLSRAPFRADCLFGHPDTLLGIPVYYPPCMNAFVGADITCAVLDSGMTNMPGISLLCDIGTNGEIALWKDGTLYVTSTAAGPAFEGAGISCGCSSVPGAIDRVWLENGQVKIHTIGQAEPCGVCGSGLIDAIAVFLELERIDETGFAEKDALSLTENISLIPADVRAVQLAKGAIAAGIRTLLEEAQVVEEEIGTLFIAGGFGSHLNVASAAAIGLIPPHLQQKVCVLGNAALSGAAKILLNRQEMARAEQTAQCARHVNLGGSSRFNQHFMEAMLFGEDDLFD